MKMPQLHNVRTMSYICIQYLKYLIWTRHSPLRRSLDAEVYVDDILLTSRRPDPHDHVEDIIELLTRFHTHNLKLNPLKPDFSRKL